MIGKNKYYYSIGAGDVINISITDIDDINGSYTISPDGNVTIPYIWNLWLKTINIYRERFLNWILFQYHRKWLA